MRTPNRYASYPIISIGIDSYDIYVASKNEYVFTNKLKSLYSVMEATQLDRWEFTIAVINEKQNLHNLDRVEAIW